MERISIASIGKPHGLRGQVHAFSLTSFPELRFKKGRKYILSSPKGEEIEAELLSFSIKGDTLILGFKGIDTPEQAETIRGYSLDMDKKDAPLPEGYVRYDDLVGMNAVDESGKVLGSLLEVCEYAPTPSLRFKGNNGRVFYVPFIDAFVGEIDDQKRTILIHVVEGML